MILQSQLSCSFQYLFPFFVQLLKSWLIYIPDFQYGYFWLHFFALIMRYVFIVSVLVLDPLLFLFIPIFFMRSKEGRQPDKSLLPICLAIVATHTLAWLQSWYQKKLFNDAVAKIGRFKASWEIPVKLGWIEILQECTFRVENWIFQLIRGQFFPKINTKTVFFIFYAISYSAKLPCFLQLWIIQQGNSQEIWAKITTDYEDLHFSTKKLRNLEGFSMSFLVNS